MKKFYAEFVFDENGIVLEPDTLEDYSWWANDIIQTPDGGFLVVGNSNSSNGCKTCPPGKFL